MDFVKHDGGRKAAGFKGDTGDCVVRAIVIATGVKYREVYDELFNIAKHFEPCQKRTTKHLKMVEKIRSKPSPRTGVFLLVSDKYLDLRGYRPVKTSCLLDDDLFKKGTYIVYTRMHFSVIKDGVLYDSFDSRMTTGLYAKKCLKTVTRYWSI